MGKKPTNTTTDPRIIIGMACQDSMKSKTAHSVVSTAIGDPSIIDFLMMQSCDIVSSRTWIVQRAIERGATHLLFVDSDMLFAADTLKKLLAYDKDVIGVDYNKRKFPLETTVTYRKDMEKSTTEPFQVAVCGTGLMLINMRVFTEEKLASPWFNFGRDKFGTHVLGEDAWFCHTAQDAGYEVWIDPTIKVLHLGEYAY